MVFQFHDLDQFPVRRYSADHESRGLQDLTIVIIKLISVAVALEDISSPVGRVCQGSLLYLAGIGTQPHAAALVTRDIAFLHGLAAVIIPLFEQVDHRLVCFLIEFGTVGVPDAGKITSNLDHGTLHSKTNAEVGYVPLPRIFYRFYLPFHPAYAKSAGNKDAVHTLEHFPYTLAFDVFRVDPGNSDLRIIGNTAMGERFAQALVRFLEFDIFSDKGDR